ncbi:MAG: P-loop NTPase fold protein [Polyangiaceae bacterium]
METDDPSCILVVGSLPEERRKDKLHFEQTCRALGEAIAVRGYSLLVGSLDESTADPDAVFGYVKAGGERPILSRPGSQSGADLGAIWTSHTSSAPRREFEALASDDYTAWRNRSVARADGVVLIGGAKGTALVHRLCLIRGKPFVALPSFNGSARNAHDDLQQFLSNAHLKDQLEQLSAATTYVPAAIDLLASLLPLRDRMFPNALLRSEGAEPHAAAALGWAAQLAGGPVTSSRLFQALVASPGYEGAFKVFQSLLAELRPSLESASVPRLEHAAPDRVALAPTLLESLRIARAAVPLHYKIRGRVLITAALFDPELSIARALRSQLRELRDRWRHFLLEDKDPSVSAATWSEVFDELERRLTRSTEASQQERAPSEKSNSEKSPREASLHGSSPHVQPPPDATPTPTAPPTPHGVIDFATPGNDDPWDHELKDQLSVGDEAKAFARLAAAKQFKPPLAVGVFGDWGAGKSFFMRLVHEHVAALSEGVKGRSEAVPEAGDAAFHTSIVQVRFNAWHYAETNLWASLVDHLFTELDRWLRARQAPSGADPLLEQLSTARELTLGSAEELLRRRKEQRAATERLHSAERALEQITGAAGRSPQVLLTALKAALKKDAKMEAVQAQFDKAARQLGLFELGREATNLEETARALDADLQRADLLRKNIGERLHSGWVVVLFAAACLLVPILLGFAVEKIPHLKRIHEGVVELGGILASAAAIIGAVSARVRWVLNRLEQAKSKLDEAIDAQLKAPTAELASKQEELRRLTGEAEEARVRFSTSTDRLAEATRDYASGTGSGRLLDFIRTRATDGQYARHLGLIATVRKDFEELASNLEGASSEAQAALAKARETFKVRIEKVIHDNTGLLTPEEAEKLRESAAEKPAPVTFQRIILYIDDLDRCPPDKVVDVLQALHLLLTFPMFVVFVAVDVRWVSRSLEKQYGDLLDSPAVNGASPPSGARASAHDYLEKIFQVPYWVRPMDDAASTAFMTDRVKAYLAAPKTSEATPIAATAAVPTPPATLPHVNLAARADTSAAGTSASSDSTTAPEPSASAASPNAPAATPTQTSAAPTNGHATNGHATNGDTTAAPTASATNAAMPTAPGIPAVDARALSLSGDEVKQLRLLAPFIGTSPRRALRFLNVYRVVKASMKKGDLDILDKGGYRALMTQLAIATGAPELSPVWHDTLKKYQGDKLEGLLTDLKSAKGYEGALERRQLDGALACYAEFAELKPLRTYAPIAQRYSFKG